MKRSAQVVRALLALCLCAAGELHAQMAGARPAAELYLRLRNVGLDAARVYRIRDARIDREDLHLSLNEGVLAFTEAVDGRITGAFFAGDGDVLLRPPDHAERWSLAVFTKAAVLEEGFSSAYLRFNDDLAEELRPALRPLDIGATDEDDTAPAVTAESFVARWNPTAKALGSMAALRLLVTFVNANGVRAPFAALALPPRSGGGESARNLGPSTRAPKAGAPAQDDNREEGSAGDDRLLYCRIAGRHLGIFDVMFDTKAAEQITVAQGSMVDGRAAYDYWTSFPMRSVRARFAGGTRTAQTQAAAESAPPVARIAAYKIRARVTPPHELEAETTADIVMGESGQRILQFELSRFLKVKGAWLGDVPLEVVQNEALEGSALAQRGNDSIAVVFPRALAAGERLPLRVSYAGDVLSEAGGGLMYVGARGSWYPNFGPAMADFDLTFQYPAGWTLVATGKRVAEPAAPGEVQAAHFVSERPMPLAGFNIGRYVTATAQATGVRVETYATRGVETAFADAGTTLVVVPGPRGEPTVMTVPRSRPSPAAHAKAVAEQAARAVDFFAARLGAFPYSTLALAQMPGALSQGWPGLVFLSSYAFVAPEERRQARLSEIDALVSGRLTTPHETAHQWWGDLLLWNSYREQWLSEALANYCALLMLEREHPNEFNLLMEYYRTALLAPTKEGRPVGDAGPVTLGFRLNSTRFPGAYEPIVYGRGTWLFHMLRSLISESGAGKTGDEAFFAVLRGLREKFEGRAIYTRDVQRAFTDALPASVRYEGRKSLDWFFDGWVNGTAVPHLELKDVKFRHAERGAVVSGKIVQAEAPPELVTPVPIYSETNGKRALLGWVFAEGSETAFRLSTPASTQRVLLDPYRTVLRR